MLRTWSEKNPTASLRYNCTCGRGTLPESWHLNWGELSYTIPCGLGYTHSDRITACSLYIIHLRLTSCLYVPFPLIINKQLEIKINKNDKKTTWPWWLIRFLTWLNISPCILKYMAVEASQWQSSCLQWGSGFNCQDQKRKRNQSVNKLDYWLAPSSRKWKIPILPSNHCFFIIHMHWQFYILTVMEPVPLNKADQYNGMSLLLPK